MSTWYDTEDEDFMATDDAVAMRETEKALLVVLNDGSERWFPKSCIGDDSDVFAEDGAGRLVVKTWFLERQDWY